MTSRKPRAPSNDELRSLSSTWRSVAYRTPDSRMRSGGPRAFGGQAPNAGPIEISAVTSPLLTRRPRLQEHRKNKLPSRAHVVSRPRCPLRTHRRAAGRSARARAAGRACGACGAAVRIARDRCAARRWRHRGRGASRGVRRARRHAGDARASRRRHAVPRRDRRAADGACALGVAPARPVRARAPECRPRGGPADLRRGGRRGGRARGDGGCAAPRRAGGGDRRDGACGARRHAPAPARCGGRRDDRASPAHAAARPGRSPRRAQRRGHALARRLRTLGAACPGARGRGFTSPRRAGHRPRALAAGACETARRRTSGVAGGGK